MRSNIERLAVYRVIHVLEYVTVMLASTSTYDAPAGEQ
jgi:hypothetical protein